MYVRVQLPHAFPSKRRNTNVLTQRWPPGKNGYRSMTLAFRPTDTRLPCRFRNSNATHAWRPKCQKRYLIGSPAKAPKAPCKIRDSSPNLVIISSSLYFAAVQLLSCAHIHLKRSVRRPQACVDSRVPQPFFTIHPAACILADGACCSACAPGPDCLNILAACILASSNHSARCARPRVCSYLSRGESSLRLT